MGGWHTRLWRRVRIAPEVTINLTKSGPSVSVGPRGAKMTFGSRGVRQTLGIPGTGIYATRQITNTQLPTPQMTTDSVPMVPTAPMAAPVADPAIPVAHDPAPVANPDDDGQVVLYFGLATVVGVLIGAMLYLIGTPSDQATGAGFLAVVVGIAYEGLAHHHPGPAKALASVVVGMISILTAFAIAVGVGVVGAILLGAATGGSTRRRKGSW